MELATFLPNTFIIKAIIKNLPPLPTKEAVIKEKMEILKNPADIVMIL